MAITDIPILQMLRTRLQWSQERQRVLAENVANSDTPNYRLRVRPGDGPDLLDLPGGADAIEIEPGHGQHLRRGGKGMLQDLRKVGGLAEKVTPTFARSQPRQEPPLAPAKGDRRGGSAGSGERQEEFRPEGKQTETV